MMKQLRKVLSILCAIALLISGMTFALAEDTEAEAPVYEEPVYEEPVYEEPTYEEPAHEEPAYEEPVYEAPAAEEPAYEAPAAAEPAVEEPAVEEPAVEEPAVEEPVVEEPAAEEPAAEEPAAEEPAAEEPAAEDASIYNEETTDEDGLVEIDDGWGYVDPEVIEENTPEITDELKGIRNADLAVGQVLSETLEFGDELVIRLQGGNASVVTLKLYAPYGASINTKVDEKAVGFTPAESDDPSMAMYTYELTGAAGRSFEIVLSSYDTVSFRLAAVAEQAEEITEPAEQEEELFPAEEEIETTDDEPSDEYITEDTTEDTTEETPVPTLQVSVKTYDALKVGHSISDSLISGQKAKIMVKCGKNLNVALTMTADPDDVVVTIDGNDAAFIPAGDGTYTCILNDVAFRKFNIVIAAKQDLDFTLSAASAGNQFAEGEEEDDEEEKTEDINKEETETEPAEEVTEESVEEAKTAEEAEKTEEPAEESEKTEETTEEAAETPEEKEGEEAEQSEDNTEENEKMIGLGCSRIIVTSEKGADLYAEADKEAEVIGHLDTENEAWVTLNEEKTWGQIFSEDEEAPSRFISMDDAEVKKTEEAKQAEEPKEETTEEEINPELPEDRSVSFTVTWEENTDEVVETFEGGDAEEVHTFGDLAHLDAVLEGYDGFVYTLQWQISEDGETWTDIEGANESRLDVLVDEDNYWMQWRVVVYTDLEATKELMEAEARENNIEAEEPAEEEIAEPEPAADAETEVESEPEPEAAAEE